MSNEIVQSSSVACATYREYVVKRIMALPYILTVHQFALALNVDESTVYRWIEGKVILAIHLPATGKRHNYRIPRSEYARIIGVGLDVLQGIEQDILEAAEQSAG